jgi:anti-sigma B factor antagonist
MEISEQTVGDVIVLHLKGRFVEDPANDFMQRMNAIVRSGRRKVLLNLDDVTYVDSAGLGMLVSKFVMLDRQDGKLKLCNLHRRSFRVLDITRMLTIFESFDSVDAAIASFADGNKEE